MPYEALRFEDSPSRYAASVVASSLRTGGGATIGALRHRRDLDPPGLPGPDWVHVLPRLAGICGSDLAAIEGRSSRWFEPIISLPFVPGHEVVADHDGRRVVLEAVLGCAARGIEPACDACAQGRAGNCRNVELGCVAPGLQSGFCEDTGGGWSTVMTAHPTQLREVPDELDDATAVMVEPTACAVHGALAAGVGTDETAAVLGAGTMGLGVLAALARWSRPRRLVVAARHPHQRELAARLSAPVPTTVVRDGAELRAARRVTGTGLAWKAPSPSRPSIMITPREPTHQRLTGGVDVTIDCVGSAESLATALAITRPRGRLVMLGMPSRSKVDLTPLWQREITLVGAYTYGTERLGGTEVRTFELAMELVSAAGLGELVSARYPLDRAREAITHAATAGSRGATKVCFEMRSTGTPDRDRRVSPADARDTPRVSGARR